MAKSKKYYTKKEDSEKMTDNVEKMDVISEVEEDSPVTDEVENEVVDEVQSVDTPAESVSEFDWDGSVRPGLFKKLYEAKLSEDKEKKLVAEFAKKGLAYQTTFSTGKRIDKEVVLENERDPEATWLEYQGWKKHIEGK